MPAAHPGPPGSEGPVQSGTAPLSVVVYPKVAPDEREATALTEAQRQRKALRLGRAPDDFRLWQEVDGRGATRADAYNALGLKATPGDAPIALGPGDRGIVRPLTMLGGDALWLQEGASQLEALTERLGPAFQVSTNARLLSPEAPGFNQNAAMVQAENTGTPEPFGRRYEDSGVHAAHRSGIRGRGVVCAVLDTGVDADHADFAQRRTDRGTAIDFGFVLSDDWSRPPAEGRGFDLFGHGTHICSIIGGQKGVAPAAGMICAAAPQTRLTSNVVMFSVALDWLLARIEAAGEYGRRVILNLSLGFPDPGEPDAPAGADYPKALATFNAILDAVIDLDVLVVAAIGNRKNKFVMPGGRPDVLSVGAVAGDLRRPAFSGHVIQERRPARTGPRVMGFGEGVTAADRRSAGGDDVWVRRSGTSQAAAYVSGVAALIWSQHQGLSALRVAELIEADALALDDMSIQHGAGLARFGPAARRLR